MSLSKYTVVPLLQEATEQVLRNKLGIIGDGFLYAGICSWIPNAVDQTRMKPSSVFTLDVASNMSTTPIQKDHTTPTPSTSVARGSEEKVSLVSNS